MGGSTVKPFIVFWGSRYYPEGGAKDSMKEFNTDVEAVAFAEGIVADETLKWAHVMRTSDRQIVHEVQS